MGEVIFDRVVVEAFPKKRYEQKIKYRNEPYRNLDKEYLLFSGAF